MPRDANLLYVPFAPLFHAVLDASLEASVVQCRSPGDIAAAGFGEATARCVVRLIDLSEYKHRQAAANLKVKTKTFGVGCRFPVAQPFRQ